VKGLVGLIALMEEHGGLTYGESVLSRCGAGVLGIVVEAGGLGGLFWLSSQTTEKSGSSTGPDIFELSHLLEVKPQVRRWVILVW